MQYGSWDMGPLLRLHNGDRGFGLRSGVAVFAEHFEVVCGGFLDEGFGFREGVGGGYATREVGKVCGVASWRLLDDGGVFHGECSSRGVSYEDGFLPSQE